MRCIYGDRGNLGGFKSKGVLRDGGGMTISTTRMYGSAGYFIIIDDEVGGSYEVVSGIPDVRWAIARVR